MQASAGRGRRQRRCALSARWGATALPTLPGQAAWRSPRCGRATRQALRGAVLAPVHPRALLDGTTATSSSVHAGETVTTLLDGHGRRRAERLSAEPQGCQTGPVRAEGPPASCFWLPGCLEGPLTWPDLKPWSRGHREASAGHLRTGRSRWCSRSTGCFGTGPAPPRTRPHLQHKGASG